MNSFNLITYLTSNLNIEEDEIRSIHGSCLIREYKKEEFLLRGTEFCQHTFFVEKGLLRQYAIDEKGKEYILHFAPVILNKSR